MLLCVCLIIADRGVKPQLGSLTHGHGLYSGLSDNYVKGNAEIIVTCGTWYFLKFYRVSLKWTCNVRAPLHSPTTGLL